MLGPHEAVLSMILKTPGTGAEGMWHLTATQPLVHKSRNAIIQSSWAWKSGSQVPQGKTHIYPATVFDVQLCGPGARDGAPFLFQLVTPRQKSDMIMLLTHLPVQYHMQAFSSRMLARETEISFHSRNEEGKTDSRR